MRHQVLREVGEPFTLMIDQARYHDLMIFGLRSLFEFDLVPDPHNALVRLVQAGVRPLIAVSKGFYPVKKVLIAYSGSMESAKAMKRFVQMRLWPEAKLRIVTFEHEAEQGGATRRATRPSTAEHTDLSRRRHSFLIPRRTICFPMRKSGGRT